MAATKKILIEIHGRRLGISQLGELILDGKAVVTENDTGVAITKAPVLTNKTTTTTLTPAELFNGLIVGTHAAGANQVYTLPDAAAMLAYLAANQQDLANYVVGTEFSWMLVNNSTGAANTIQITGSTGHAVPINAPLVPSIDGNTGANLSTWRTVRTAAATFATWRVS